MSDPMRQRFHVFDGPSLLAPFAAASVEFRTPFERALRTEIVGELLPQFVPPALMKQVALPLRDGTFETVAAALAVAIQDCHGANGLDVSVVRSGDRQRRILLGYVDSAAAILALGMGLDLADGFFSHAAGLAIDRQALTARLQATVAQMQARQPGPLARSMIRAARRRGIPVYPVAPGSGIWQFGQGRAGVHFFETASHLDSLTGPKLARNKFLSNELVTRLGFPGVNHEIADSVEAAKRLARDIGYPVVIKPVDSGKGEGVTAYITTEDELAAAYAVATRAGKRQVLVERHVMGDDHRLVVIGGRFAWAVRRSPPRVEGDGMRSISELIEIENHRRAASPVADIAFAPVRVDDEVLQVLAAQGLTLADRPAQGTSVSLRRIANVSRGGTLADCTAFVHPDNLDMAEALARGFHLDAAGIDFMTTDISRSWRDVDCAVLELNSTPGFSSDGRADTILQAKFAPGRDGRIPGIVLVGASPETLGRVAEAIEAAGYRVGRTDSELTFMAGRPRLTGAAPLPARVMALLRDPSCDVVVIAATPEQTERHGFPLARCEMAWVGGGAGLTAGLDALVESCADEVRRGSPGNDLDEEEIQIIVSAVRRSAPPPQAVSTP